jgi:hypothetical protein
MKRREFLERLGLFTLGILADPLPLFGEDGKGSYKNNVERNESLNNEYMLIANIPAYSLSLYKNGEKIKDYLISVGKPRTPTPLGDYKIMSKANWGGSFGGTWMRFKSNPGPDGKEQGGWGIHGCIIKEFLGHAVSKGCIRMDPDEAKELKKIIPIGTPLKNIYEIVGIDIENGLIEIRADIYNRVRNLKDYFLENLLVEDGFINITKLEKILEEASRRTHEYVKMAKELYRKYIRPLDEIPTDLLQRYPKINDYLKKMEENKKLVLEFKELLT